MLSFQSATIPSYKIRTIYIQTILQNYKEIGGGPCQNVDQEIAKTTVLDASYNQSHDQIFLLPLRTLLDLMMY